MFLKIQSHIVDIDIVRHDFHTAEEAHSAFDGITKLLQAQTVGLTTKEET